MTLVLHVCGAPGSGKTTLARALARDLALPMASVDEERRKLLRPGQSWPSDDSKTWEALRQTVETHPTLILETMGGTANSAALLEGRDAVNILVSAPDPIRHERIRDRARLRTDPMIGRPDKYVQYLTKIPAPDVRADAEWNGTHPIPGEQYDALLTTLRQSVGETSERSPLVDMTVKFAEGSDTIIEGLGVPFGIDLDGEQFTAKTDLCLDWFPKGGRPILYHHGFNDSVKMEAIGHELESTLTDDGLWVRAELDKASKFYKRVKKLVEEQAVGWSSGAPDHKVKMGQGSKWDRWPVVEYSLTPTPAFPNRVSYAMKSAEVIEHLEAADVEIPEPLSAAEIEQTQDVSEPETLAAHIKRYLADGKALGDRLDERVEFRLETKEARKSGRVLSAANLEALDEVIRLLQSVRARATAEDNEAEASKAALELQLALTG